MRCGRSERATPIGSKDAIGALTGLRGAAAVAVVVYHYFCLPSSYPFTTFVGHGYLAVDLFFVLSGFVLAMNYGQMFASGWSSGSYVRFLGRRIARIYPLYLVATIVGFLLIEMKWIVYPQDVPLGVALGLNLIMVQVWGFVQSFDGPGWSISAEWAAYLLFPALLVPTMARKPFWGYLFAAACAGTLAILCVFSAFLSRTTHMPGAQLYFWEPSLALPVLRCLPEFALGMLAFRAAATPLGLAIGGSSLISPLTCLAIIALMAAPGTDLQIVLLLPLLIVSLASGTHVIGRILASPAAKFLGLVSYSMYLTHIFLLDAVANVTHALARGFGLTGLPLQTCTAMVGLALTILIAYFAYMAIEVPGRRWLRASFE